MTRELDHRKRRLRILSYNDLLTGLAKALEAQDSPARDRMRRRWRIVLVDEFQDTDLIQWQVLERAFSGYATLILIGDPKQAIYGFRGGDIHTYLKAPAPPMPATRWASTGAATNRSSTACKPCCRAQRWATPRSSCTTSTLTTTGTGWRGPHNAPFRLRVVKRSALGYDPTLSSRSPDCANTSRRSGADIADLLASGATYAGRPVQPGHIAVIVTGTKTRGHAEMLWPARHCGDLQRRQRCVRVAGRQGLVVSAGSVRRAAPQRAGPRRRVHVVLRCDRRNPGPEGDALTDRVPKRCASGRVMPPSRCGAVFEAAQRRAWPTRARRAGRRAAHDRPGAHHAAAAPDGAPGALQHAALRDWLRRQCDTARG
ncbi:uvrD/REP helicase N-terminal domain protein [Mycobacterium xenopi 4042]|uniref:UvrD/REP helicase N-terminal domain protein n=1 Tax=Mycobacterium xenopi 4042 TaxID=1299334 RepID=X7Z408_MYCXE|nr:uvrD/REP helicase N-terminal domain protein [Mycobacterium xenopi 4042]